MVVGEELGLGNVGAIAGSAAGIIGQLLSWLVILALLGGVGLFIMWLLSFKHQVVVRLRARNRKYIIKDRAKEVKDDGVTMWRLLRLRRTVTPPPPEAIEITKGGKFFAECYYSNDNPEPIWLLDSNEQEGSFQPFKTQERALHIARQRKALARKNKGILDVIQQLAVPAALVMVVIVMFVFWDDIAAPAKQMAQINEQMMEQQAKISEQNARIASVLAGQIESGDLKLIQELPPDAPPDILGVEG